MDSVRLEIDAGFACLARGEWAGAVRHLGAAVRRDPGSFRVVRGLVTAHLRSGDTAEARRVIGAFILAYPLSAEGWRLAGQLEWKAGRRDEAIAILSRGLERLPGSGVLNRQRALFLGAMGEVGAAEGLDHRDALTGYLAAARGEGNAVEGIFAGDSRSDAEVEADWLDRVAREPALLDGVLRVADGRTDRGVLRDLLGRVSGLLDVQPRHADRQLALARLQLTVGDVEGARASVGRALEANPFYADARQLKEELESRRRVGARRAA